jgi:hypothetical protein
MLAKLRQNTPQQSFVSGAMARQLTTGCITFTSKERKKNLPTYTPRLDFPNVLEKLDKATLCLPGSLVTKAGQKERGKSTTSQKTG